MFLSIKVDEFSFCLFNRHLNQWFWGRQVFHNIHWVLWGRELHQVTGFLLFALIDQCTPDLFFLQRPRVANHKQKVARPSQRNIETAQILQKAESLVVVWPDAVENDNFTFLALEAVHSVYADSISIWKLIFKQSHLPLIRGNDTEFILESGYSRVFRWRVTN